LERTTREKLIRDPFAVGRGDVRCRWLFGLAIFHGAGPVSRAVSDGYGIAYSTIATAETTTAESGDAAKRILAR
jgi:hypothetical protein